MPQRAGTWALLVSLYTSASEHGSASTRAGVHSQEASPAFSRFGHGRHLQSVTTSPPSQPIPPSPPPPSNVSITVSHVADLIDALSNPSIGRIVIAPGRYNLTAELSVSRSVIIEAATAGTVVLDAGKASNDWTEIESWEEQEAWSSIFGDGAATESGGIEPGRVVHVDPGSSGVVHLVGLNLTGGYVTDSYETQVNHDWMNPGPPNAGGLVISSGQVTIEDVAVYENYCYAIHGYVGGVLIVDGNVTFKNSTVHHNRAFHCSDCWHGHHTGGIVVNRGMVTFFSCEIHHNIAATHYGVGGLSIGDATVLFVKCTIHHNDVSGIPSYVGGLILNSGSVTFQTCQINNNVGGEYGGMYLESGTMTMQNTSVANNTQPDVYSFVPILLLHPAPLGTYLQGAFQCEEISFLHGEPAIHQKCDWEQYRGQYLTNLIGSFTNGFPPACIAGSFGNSSSVAEQLNPICAGNCPSGHYCPPGTVRPIPCPPGTSSSMGTSLVNQCVSCAAGFFAPRAGSASCRQCSSGTYQNGTRATGCEVCPVGHFCSFAMATRCPFGSWCADGEQHACEAGLLGNMTGLSTRACNGRCPQGYYCMLASTAAEPCPAGKYGKSSGLKAVSECTRTAPGYYSPLGSASAQPCGGSSLFCKGGGATPQPVTGMHAETYTDSALNPSLDPDNPATRTSVRACRAGFYCESGHAIRCPLGHWCANGTQHACAAGTMGNMPQLRSPACNGQCIKGHYCHEASTAAKVCPPGTVGEHRGLGHASNCSACPGGNWCNSGKQFPCLRGFYTASGASSSARQNLDACLHCPPHSTTAQQASATARSCICDVHFYRKGGSVNVTCEQCPTGTSCEVAGTTLASLPVKDAYWKPGYLSVDAKPCPFRSTCYKGSTPTERYNASSASTCAPGKGVAGVYCLLCAEAGHYFDTGLEACKPCADEAVRVLLFLGGIALVVLALVLVARYHVVARTGCSVAWHTLVISARRASLTTKAKICISYYQIITQLDRVYAIVYPPAYAHVIKVLNSIFHVFFGWIPGVATACAGLGLTNELLLICFVPLIVVLAAFGIGAVYRKPLVSMLPFALKTSFLCFPFVASRGFRALAPCNCFKYVDGGAACFLHDAYSIECVPVAPGKYMSPNDVRLAAWLAIGLYACVVPVGYALLLFASRHSLGRTAPPTPLSRALVFLSGDYEPRVFGWELVEVARKITITGFLALVDPGSLLQLYLGVTVALLILILQMYACPYVSVGDNFLSMISASALVLTLLASLGIQLTELTPELSSLGLQQTGLSSDALPLVVTVLVVSSLLVLLVALAMFAQQLHQTRKLPIARWASSGAAAVPRILPHGAFHAFVSHQWSSGQDQARAIKVQLVALIPGLRVFLDVDDLTDIGALEALIDATDVVIVFLSGSTVDGVELSHYMRSANCLRELRRAIEAKKRIVFVSETDAQHGAVSAEVHRRDCPEDLRHALDEHPTVPWYRVKEYGQVSLRQIAQLVVDGALRLPGELLYARLRTAALGHSSFHLYAPGAAAEVAKLLCTEASELMVTSNPEERRTAMRFLLYLNASHPSWEDAAVRAEIDAALADDMPLLLVHEQRRGRGAVPFSTIIARTPPSLLERGIFKSLAVPLVDGDEHQRVCLRVMLGGAPDLPSTRGSNRSPWRCWRWSNLHRRHLQVAGADGDAPALLAVSGREMKGLKDVASAKV